MYDLFEFNLSFLQGNVSSISSRAEYNVEVTEMLIPFASFFSHYI